MNIVVLAPESVYPANTGGRIVVYNKIKELSKLGNKITLLCIVDSDDEGKKLKEGLSKLCEHIYAYNRNKFKFDTFRYFVRYPYAVASRSNKQLQRRLKLIMKCGKVDYILCEFPQMALNLLHFGKIFPTLFNFNQGI